MLAGLLPAWRSSRPNLVEALKEAGRGTGGGGRHRLGMALVTGQMALAVMLLVGAGLMVRSFRGLATGQPNLDPASLLTMRISLDDSRYHGDAAVAGFYGDILARIAALPGALALLALGAALWDAAQFLLRTHDKTPDFHRGDAQKDLLIDTFSPKELFAHSSSPSAFNWVLGGLCLLVGLLSIGQAALPEVYFDSLTYHLSALRGWFQAQGLTNLSTNLYTAFPFGGEMDFLGAFRWGSGEAVKGLNAFILILLAMAAGAWAWEESGKNSAFLAAGLVLSFPLAVTGAWTAQVDILQALFTLLFFYCLSKGKGSNSSLLTSGIMAGSALAVKYTALLGLGVGLLFWGSGLLAQIRKKPFLVPGLLVPPILLFLPWLLKNWAYTANPLYPYLGSWFGGHGLPAERMAQLMRDHIQSFAPGETLAFWAQRVFTRDMDKTIAPVLFSFLPLLFLGKGAKGRPCMNVFRNSNGKLGRTFLHLIVETKKCPAMKLLAAGGLSLFLGLAVTHQLRLGLGSLIICFVGMSLFVEKYLEKGLRKGWKTAVLVFFALNLTAVLRLGVLYFGDVRVWDGAENREAYLTQCPQTATYYPLARDCGRWFSQDEKLLVAGDARGLYYSLPVITNSVFDVQVMAGLARESPDGEGIALALKEMGVNGLVVMKDEGLRLSRGYTQYPLTDEEWGRIDGFIQHHTRLLELTPLGGIYRFSPESLPKQRLIPDLFLCFKPLSKP